MYKNAVMIISYSVSIHIIIIRKFVNEIISNRSNNMQTVNIVDYLNNWMLALENLISSPK